MIHKIVKDYSIQKELGQGGMATVYLAEHNLLGNKSAFKLLNKEYVHNENIRKRFLAEARSMARMSHSNIIKVTDLIDDGEMVAFVMEYVEGETLKEYIERKGKLSDDEIKSIFTQMLDAVGYVHEQNLVHRDIKPSNFMVSPNGNLKLMDFGIAKNTDVNSAEYTQTGTGVQMGTPMYMSPEQITETKSVTPQSDIYSLGVVLWQMATGEKPYDMKTLSTFHLQMKIVQEELPLTNTSWDTFIKKATSKNNENRFSSCKEFSLKLNSDNNTLQVNDADKTIVNSVQNSEKTIIEQKVPTEVLLEGSVLDSEGNLKYGLINLKGEWVIQPMFDSALYPDEQGFSRANLNDKYGVIDRKGNWIIQPMFEYLGSFDEQGYTKAELNEKYGFIDRKGNWIIQPMFESVDDFDSENFLCAKLNDKWGGIDRKGNWLIQPMFDEINNFDNQGYAAAELNDKRGFIDRKGNWIVQPIFDDINNFDNQGYAAAELNDKRGFIDRKGNWVIQPIFDYVSVFDDQGYAGAELNGKFGFIDIKGNWIIQPIFDSLIFDFGDQEDYACVQLNEKWGMIDRKGNWFIQPMFDDFFAYDQEGYACVQLNEKWGFLDRKGKMIIQPIFDSISYFDHQGYAYVKLNKKCGFIDSKGNWVIQPIFDSVSCFDDKGYSKARLNEKFGFIDRKGNWVIQPIFDYIIEEDDDLFGDHGFDDRMLEEIEKLSVAFSELSSKSYYLQEIPDKKMNNFWIKFKDFIPDSNTSFFWYYDDTLFGKGDDGFAIVKTSGNQWLLLIADLIDSAVSIIELVSSSELFSGDYKNFYKLHSINGDLMKSRFDEVGAPFNKFLTLLVVDKENEIKRIDFTGFTDRKKINALCDFWVAMEWDPL